MAPKTNNKVPSVKLGTMVTPIGDALFVSSPRPSAFDPNKEEATIVLSAEDAAKVVAEIQAKLKEHEAELPAPIASLKMPMKDGTDKEGNPDGTVHFKSKTSIKYPARFFDANGGSFKPGADFQVSNRSRIRLSVGLEVVKTSLYTGVVARLNAIKIISSSPWASANPFGDTQDDGDFAYDANAPQGNDFDSDDTGSDDWAD